MRILTYLLIATFLITSSCASANKRLRNKQTTESLGKTLMPSTPIREVEEKLVSHDEQAPDPHTYFVIIGSFRNPGNAKEHQALVASDGFKSGLLKNEAGLYRVSVLATDDVTKAREEVRRIWAKFPKYADTWLLIQLK